MSNTRTYSTAQEAYFQAKAAYDLAVEAATAETPHIESGASEAEFEAWNDAIEAAEAKHNVWSLSDAMRAAEHALVFWAKHKISSDPDPTCVQLLTANRADVSMIFANYARYPQIRERMIDLCLCLKA